MNYQEDLNRLLFSAVSRGNLVDSLRLIAKGADVNWTNDCEMGGRTCLHEAVLSCPSHVAEFLVLNGSKINVVDKDGRTPIHLAVANGKRSHLAVLIKKGAKLDLKDHEGHDILSIALYRADADIVTL